MDNQADHMSIHEAAAFYGVSEKTIRRRLKAGKLKAFKHEADSGRLEWRIFHVDKADLSWTETHDQEGQMQDIADRLGMDTHAWGLPSAPSARIVMDTDEDSSRDTVVLSALQLVDRLQRETTQLAGQLGFVQAQLQEAQEQIRLLTVAVGEPKAALSWWQRWLRKGRTDAK